MANSEHLAQLRRGVSAWNEWRKKNPDVVPDLSMEDFREADFSGANFLRTNLRHTLLQGANLAGANFRRAVMERASLVDANCRRTCFQRADLRHGKLQNANVEDADFERANLSHADLSGVEATRANFKRGVFTNAYMANGVFVDAQFARAELQWANLNSATFTGAAFSRANLRDAAMFATDFSDAHFKNTHALSKSAFARLKSPLAIEQSGNISFESPNNDLPSSLPANRLEPPIPALRLYTDDGDWTPIELGSFLIGIQDTFNRLQYLQTTSQTELEVIASEVETYAPDHVTTIRVTDIHSGSLELFLSYVKDVPPEITMTLVTAATLFMGFSRMIKVIDDHLLAQVNRTKIAAEAEKIRTETAIMRASRQAVSKDLAFELEKNMVQPESFQPPSPTVREHANRLLVTAMAPTVNAIVRLKNRNAAFMAEVGIKTVSGKFEPSKLSHGDKA